MADMVYYVKKYGCYSFDELPFSETDALVLAQVSYFDFNKSLDRNTSFNITLKEAIEKSFSKEMFMHIWNPKKNELLAKEIMLSSRFGNMLVGHYVSLLEKEIEEQFSAITFMINKELLCITYRGTDSTLVGWKEDFNLGYLKNIPSQIDSVKYLEGIDKIYNKRYIVCGHSKGGHLSTYASIIIEKDIQDKIISVYNFDGPGFLIEFENEQYQRIKPRMNKLIPRDAFVGLLLRNDEDYKVVENYAIFILQHDLFNWVINKDRIKYVDNLSIFARHAKDTVMKTIVDMDNDTRKVFINTLYEIALETKDETTGVFAKNLIKNVPLITKKLVNLDKDKQKVIKEVILSLAKSYLKVEPKRLIQKNKNDE